MPDEIQLRPATEEDLQLLYKQLQNTALQEDDCSSPIVFNDFKRTWSRSLSNTSIIHRAIFYNDRIVGSISSEFLQEMREISFQIENNYWDNQLATQILEDLLEIDTFRPIYASASENDSAYRHVLEKCGFKPCGMAVAYCYPPQDPIIIYGLGITQEQVDQFMDWIKEMENDTASLNQ